MLEIKDPNAVGLCPNRLGRIDDWMDKQVTTGRLPGLSVAVMRKGELAYFRCTGLRDVEHELTVESDTIFRIYSMTKPITSVAVLMLYEQGAFQLDDPVSRFIPAFKGLRVYAGGTAEQYDTVASDREITIRDLMTHTAGLTYGFIASTPVDQLYREHDVDFQTADQPLKSIVERLCALPLLSQPGAEWNYSVATDVLGYLIELIAEESFETFLQNRVLRPLGMSDTGFHVREEAVNRFAANYAVGNEEPDKNGILPFSLVDPSRGGRFTRPAVTYSGGGGLVSTASDYLRFAQFMLNRGELEGVRLLAPKTVDLMTSNHLGTDMEGMGQPRFSESSYAGVGFGLGVSVMLDPARAQILGTPGEYAWGGAASTAFWVDPSEALIVLLLTQLMPSSTYPVRRELRVLSYQAIVES